jgi:hypothetical protein
MPLDTQQPIGTLEAVLQNGADPAKVFSCAAPDRNRAEGVVKGCPYWGICKFPEKGKSGPLNFGVRIVKKNGGVRNTIKACFELIPHLHVMRESPANADLYKIIAREGQEIKIRGSVSTPPSEIGQLPTWSDKTLVMKVEAFPRIGEHPMFIESVEVVAARKEALDDAEMTAMRDRLGVKDAPQAIPIATSK